MQTITIIKTLTVLSALTITTGCAPSSKESPTPPPVPTAENSAAPLDLQQLLCQGKDLCQILRTWDAGKDDDNQPMQVAEITLNTTITEALKSNMFSYDENNERQCEPLQYWFVQPTRRQASAPNSAPVLLLELCNDGYGAAGVGEDTIEVSPNRFTHTRLGGSNARWSETRSVELPSLRLLGESTSGWHVFFPENDATSMDWTRLFARHTGFNPGCEEREEVRDAADYAVQDNYAYDPIFILSTPDSFRSDGWKTTALGTCSGFVTSTQNRGFVTHAHASAGPGTDTDASFKVLMASPTELYVEITDDTWIETAPSVLHTDHLEIWARSDVSCPQATPQSLFQWGITLDANVQTLYGKPARSPTAERVVIQNDDATRTYRFKITLPRTYSALTVVYSDSDDARTQKRLIATSALKYRDQFTLGHTREIRPNTGTCQIHNDTLNYVPTPRTTPGPVLD